MNWLRLKANERSRLIGMSGSGGIIGTIVALSFGGYLCVNGFYNGWGSIFFLFGTYALRCLLLSHFSRY